MVPLGPVFLQYCEPKSAVTGRTVPCHCPKPVGDRDVHGV